MVLRIESRASPGCLETTLILNYIPSPEFLAFLFAKSDNPRLEGKKEKQNQPNKQKTVRGAFLLLLDIQASENREPGTGTSENPLQGIVEN